jgi:hypothetical protein
MSAPLPRLGRSASGAASEHPPSPSRSRPPQRFSPARAYVRCLCQLNCNDGSRQPIQQRYAGANHRQFGAHVQYRPGHIRFSRPGRCSMYPRFDLIERLQHQIPENVAARCADHEADCCEANHYHLISPEVHPAPAAVYCRFPAGSNSELYPFREGTASPSLIFWTAEAVSSAPVAGRSATRWLTQALPKRRPDHWTKTQIFVQRVRHLVRQGGGADVRLHHRHFVCVPENLRSPTVRQHSDRTQFRISAGRTAQQWQLND